jgi:hypothetical protein
MRRLPVLLLPFVVACQPAVHQGAPCDDDGAQTCGNLDRVYTCDRGWWDRDESCWCTHRSDEPVECDVDTGFTYSY